MRRIPLVNIRSVRSHSQIVIHVILFLHFFVCFGRVRFARRWYANAFMLQLQHAGDIFLLIDIDANVSSPLFAHFSAILRATIDQKTAPISNRCWKAKNEAGTRPVRCLMAIKRSGHSAVRLQSQQIWHIASGFFSLARFLGHLFLAPSHSSPPSATGQPRVEFASLFCHLQLRPFGRFDRQKFMNMNKFRVDRAWAEKETVE